MAHQKRHKAAIGLLAIIAATVSAEEPAENTGMNIDAPVLADEYNSYDNSSDIVFASEDEQWTTRREGDVHNGESVGHGGGPHPHGNGHPFKCPGRFPPPLWKTRRFRQHCGLGQVFICPCDYPLYREYNGACNNPRTQALGSVNTPYNRIMDARYSDGISAVIKTTGSDHLPLARVISYNLATDRDEPDPVNSIMLMQWGQYISHDTGRQEDKVKEGGGAYDCCYKDAPRHQRSASTEEEFSWSHSGDGPHGGGSSACLPIVLPREDPFYSKHYRRCMNFVRSRTANCDEGQGDSPFAGPGGHAFGKRQTEDASLSHGPHNHNAVDQINHVTSFLDASFMYGSDANQNARLRLGQGGLLKVREVHGSESEEDSGGYSHRGSYDNHHSYEEKVHRAEIREFPPLTTGDDKQCHAHAKRCYLTGDDRVNTHVWLSSLNVIFVREHNRIARRLHYLHPDWDDETLFQEARRIFIALWQLITYRDYLPRIVGRKILSRMNLLIGDSRRGKYSAKVNPSTLNEFATAAFRYLHSQIQGNIELLGEGRCPVKYLRLSDHYLNPSVVEEGYNLESIIRGMTHQAAQQSDNLYTKEITRYLFKNSRAYGDDLVSKDIQRGRDHGIPSYNDMRKACGLPKADNFKDLNDVMSEKNIRVLKKLYHSVNDVDFYVGGSLENHCVDEDDTALVGPTFGCVIAEQFFRWRKGDRYFFDHGEGPGAFTDDQYKAITKVTFASILCDNMENLKYMQGDPFQQVSDYNELKNCRDFPYLDLRPWREYQPAPNCPPIIPP